MNIFTIRFFYILYICVLNYFENINLKMNYEFIYSQSNSMRFIYKEERVIQNFYELF